MSTAAPGDYRILNIVVTQPGGVFRRREKGWKGGRDAGKGSEKSRMKVDVYVTGCGLGIGYWIWWCGFSSQSPQCLGGYGSWCSLFQRYWSGYVWLDEDVRGLWMSWRYEENGMVEVEYNISFSFLFFSLLLIHSIYFFIYFLVYWKVRGKS